MSEEPGTSPVRVSKENGMLHLQFARPEKRNALNKATWEAIPEVIDQAERDDDVSVLVLSGEGDHFCAGADISEFGTVRADTSSAAHYRDMTEVAEERLAHCAKPTIAAIEGFCIGGGLEIALACDLRIMSSSVRTGITASKLGIVYGTPATRRLVDIVGPAAARYILYSANLIDADKAAAIGLANDVVTAGTAFEAATELAATLASRSAHTIRGAKTIIDHYVAKRSENDDLDITAMEKAAIESDYYQQSVKAFNSR